MKKMKWKYKFKSKIKTEAGLIKNKDVLKDKIEYFISRHNDFTILIRSVEEKKKKEPKRY